MELDFGRVGGLGGVCGGGGDRGEGDDAGAEFDADGDVVRGLEAAFAEPEGERGFAAGGVADVDDFLGGGLVGGL